MPTRAELFDRFATLDGIVLDPDTVDLHVAKSLVVYEMWGTGYVKYSEKPWHDNLDEVKTWGCCSSVFELNEDRSISTKKHDERRTGHILSHGWIRSTAAKVKELDLSGFPTDVQEACPGLLVDPGSTLFPLAVAAGTTLQRTFATSNFKRLYRAAEAQPLEHQHQLFGSLMQLLHAYAEMIGEDRGKADLLFKALETEAFKSVKLESLLGEVAKVVIVLWTSLTSVGLNKEFCSILNHVIRQDSGDALQHAAVLSRGMAQLVVSNRKDSPARFWPDDNRSHRGTGMPSDAVDFFQEGLVYRVPMFLATSCSNLKAQEFLQRVPQDKVPVHFIFILDAVKKCDHAMYLESLTRVPGERELLYAPYSAFKILSVTRPAGMISWDEPVVIELLVQPNNKRISEDVPLAEWH